MRNPGPASAADERRSERRGTGGFTLIEAGLVLLVFALAAVLAFDLLARVQQGRRRDAFIADLREFAAAFQNYAQRHEGAFPASSDEAALPASLENQLQETNWRKGSPFGGNYDWLAPDPTSPPADGTSRGQGGAIALTAFSPSFPLTLSRRDLLDIDARIDDGNLATGRFRTGFNGWPVYLVGEAR